MADPTQRDTVGQPTDVFHRDSPPELRLWLPLPPPDNHCHRSGAYGRYPTAAYQDWLRVARPRLVALLGDWTPDTDHWWCVCGWVSLGSRAPDAQNLLKPVLDLLSGAYVVEADAKDASGKVVARKGQVRHAAGLWDDDRRVQIADWKVVHVCHDEPGLSLVVSWGPTPVNTTANRTALARMETERAREAARQQRAAEKARKAAEREARRPRKGGQDR